MSKTDQSKSFVSHNPLEPDGKNSNKQMTINYLKKGLEHYREFRGNVFFIICDLAQTLDELGSQQEAEKYWALTAERSDKPQCLNKAGEAYMMRKEFKKALVIFEKVLEIDPDHVVAKGNINTCLKEIKNPCEFLNKRGMAYLERSDYEKAMKNFRRTLAIDPENNFAKNNIEICERYMNPFAEQ